MLPNLDRADDAPAQEASPTWPDIVAAIRAHALAQPPELASELQWAEFVAGAAELRERRNHRSRTR